jgi:hypothetical protein
MGNLFSSSYEKAKTQINIIKDFVGRWGKSTKYLTIDGRKDFSEDPWITTNFDKYFKTIIDYWDGRREEYYRHEGLIKLFEQAEQKNQYMNCTQPWQIKWNNNKLIINWVVEIVFPTGGIEPSKSICFDVTSEFEVNNHLWLSNHFNEGVTAQTKHNKTEQAMKSAIAVDHIRYTKNLPIEVEGCKLCRNSFGTINILCPHK